MSIDTIQPETLKQLVSLAAEARGLEIATIDNVADIPGLPERIAVGIRHGVTPEVVDLSKLFEPWRDHPSAKRGTATALSLGSFIDLANRHKTAHSAVFANTDWRAPSLLAVIDYHEIDIVPEIAADEVEIDPPDAADPDDVAKMMVAFVHETPRPGNLRHRISYAYPLSADWKVWIGADAESFGQAEFAAFIEDRIADLASPTEEERVQLESDFETKIATPSELIRLSRGLQINVESKVRNIVSLQSGAAQIVFEEVHSDSDGQPLTVPGLFVLRIAPFASGTPIRIPVRLRYRKQGGALVWSFKLYRPDQYITARLREDIEEVKTQTTLPVFEGSPEV